MEHQSRGSGHLGREDEALASMDKATQLDPTLRGKKAENANLERN